MACTSRHDVLGEIVNATLITMMRVIPPRELSSSEYPMVQSPCGVQCTSRYVVLGEIVNATLITMMRVIPPRELSSSEYPAKCKL